MALNIEQLAGDMGAKIVAELPEGLEGSFGAARAAHIVATIQARLRPGQGVRPGRPTDPTWSEHPKVPMSAATFHKLELLAEHASRSGRKVSPMQVAAQLLEEALAEA
jgi:hypothetical protein